jgi:hypothetical protein
MDIKRPAARAIPGALGLIAKRLRAEGGSVTREALPKRWIELLQQLDLEERRTKAGKDTPGVDVDAAQGKDDPGRSD